MNKNIGSNDVFFPSFYAFQMHQRYRMKRIVVRRDRDNPKTNNKKQKKNEKVRRFRSPLENMVVSMRITILQYIPFLHCSNRLRSLLCAFCVLPILVLSRHSL